MNRRELISFLAAASLCEARPSLAAAPYPSRQVKVIVPFTAGGGTDVVARAVSPKMTEVLGQTIVVENRAGAGSNIGTDAVFKSPPDG